MSEQNRLLRSQRVSPEDDFAYGQGVSPEATWRNLIPFAEFGLGMAPVSGEAMAARDAWDASGRGGNALLRGDYGQAASEYLNMGTGLLGAIPGAGIIARGTKRGAAWMDRNLPTGFNRLLDSVYPSDPRSTTNIFAGPTAKTADHAALAKAEEMKAQGASRADIWRETGWDLEKADQIPRFEIDDSGAGLTPLAKERLAKTDEGLAAYQGNISGGFEHPELYRSYEESAPFWSDYDLRKGPGGGTYFEDNDKFVAAGRRPEQARSVTLHELQHGVQSREGFARGGSWRSLIDTPLVEDLAQSELRAAKAAGANLADEDILSNAKSNIARRLYNNLAGETEARNVQSRMNMTAAERRATPPWETQDVPDDQQIVRFGNQGPAYSAPSWRDRVNPALAPLERKLTETPVTTHGDYAIHRRMAGPNGPLEYVVARKGGSYDPSEAGYYMAEYSHPDVFASARVRMDGPNMAPVNVREDMKRRGIGTMLYDTVDEDLASIGKRLRPDEQMTPEARAFWETRNMRRGG